MKKEQILSRLVPQILIFLMVCSGTAAGKIPSSLIIRMPENGHAIVVEKQTQTVQVYSQEQGRSVFKAACSTGEVGGPKEKAGDRKTPEGVYFLKDEYEDRYLTPVYGKKAFPSDYPNFLDRRQGKQGSAIWIHGTDKALKPMDSNGCIALENENILALTNYVKLDSTPLIIVEKIENTPNTAGLEKQVSMLLDQWLAAIESDSYHAYLSFYSPDYLPKISWWETWSRIRKAAAGTGQVIGLKRENTGIYSQGGTLVVLMDFYLSRGGKTVFLGKKQFFLEKADSGFLIVGDMFQKKAVPFQGEDAPLVAAALETIPLDHQDSDVKDTIERWLAAWSAKDMDQYARFYAEEFSSDGLGKKDWVKRKKQIAKRYEYISVTGKDFKLVKRTDGYEVSFFQDYKSSGFSAQGRKQLKLVNKGGLWKISQENWKGK